MGLESFLESVRDTAKTEAEQIVGAARQERERLLSEVRTKGMALLEERKVRAKEQGQRLRVQELARAELEAKKIVLLAQKEMLEEVKRKALEKLKDLPTNEDLLNSLLEHHGSELKSGIVYCNEKDAPLVKKLVGKGFGGIRGCVGGIVIESQDGAYSLDLRYETLLEDTWESAVRSVAKTLWGE